MIKNAPISKLKAVPIANSDKKDEPKKRRKVNKDFFESNVVVKKVNVKK